MRKTLLSLIKLMSFGISVYHLILWNYYNFIKKDNDIPYKFKPSITELSA